MFNDAHYLLSRKSYRQQNKFSLKLCFCFSSIFSEKKMQEIVYPTKYRTKNIKHCRQINSEVRKQILAVKYKGSPLLLPGSTVRFKHGSCMEIWIMTEVCVLQVDDPFPHPQLEQAGETGMSELSAGPERELSDRCRVRERG